MRLVKMAVYRHTITDTASGDVIGTVENDKVVIEAPKGTTVATEDITQELADRVATRDAAITADEQVKASLKSARDAAIQRLKDADTSGQPQLIQDIVTMVREIS
jgi:hypothetical protein